MIDREPRLTLRSAGVGKRVTPQARIPLAIHAADDFGLADLALEIEKTDLAGEKPETTTKRVELEKFGADDAALPPSIDRDVELKIGRAGVGGRQRHPPAGVVGRSLCAGQPYRLVAVAGRFRSSRPTSCSTRF